MPEELCGLRATAAGDIIRAPIDTDIRIERESEDWSREVTIARDDKIA